MKKGRMRKKEKGKKGNEREREKERERTGWETSQWHPIPAFSLF